MPSQAKQTSWCLLEGPQGREFYPIVKGWPGNPQTTLLLLVAFHTNVPMTDVGGGGPSCGWEEARHTSTTELLECPSGCTCGISSNVVKCFSVVGVNVGRLLLLVKADKD
mmetsp:Transcript_28/g.68  ORF Transcript_28/g.68 Transcript_28/m.68 type:complete len:110 (+) Transcript_28:292-621(+)